MHWLLAGLGTVAILYGAVGMLAQTNLRVGLATPASAMSDWQCSGWRRLPPKRRRGRYRC
jgi:hypothetical protein